MAQKRLLMRKRISVACINEHFMSLQPTRQILRVSSPSLPSPSDPESLAYRLRDESILL